VAFNKSAKGGISYSGYAARLKPLYLITTVYSIDITKTVFNLINNYVQNTIHTIHDP
jgi:hypothetical protein